MHNSHPVQSIYRWRGGIYERARATAFLHTSRARAPEIVSREQREHPYEVPGISTRPVDGGRHITIFEKGLARLVTHEIDHLYGTLYTERMHPGQRPSR